MSEVKWSMYYDGRYIKDFAFIDITEKVIKVNDFLYKSEDGRTQYKDVEGFFEEARNGTR